MNSNTGGMPIKTKVTFKKKKSVSDLEPHMKLIWKENILCAVYTAIKQSEMGTSEERKSDSGHFGLLCSVI